MNVARFALRMTAVAAIAFAAATHAYAAVYPPSRQLSAQLISDFKASPSSLTQQFSGGPQLISRVRDLAASDPTTLGALVGLLREPTTTKEQMKAIVAGLAQVARMAAQSDAAYATEIQTAVAGTNNADVIAAYQAATGDVAIAATGGGGGGGSGSGGATGGGGASGGSGNGGPASFGNLHSATTSSSLNSRNSTGGASTGVSPH